VTDPLDAVVARIWVRALPKVLARLDVVIGALSAAAAGTAAAAEEVRDAHVLAGTLGSYGRPGSDLLRDAELLLAGTGDGDAISLAGQIRELRDQLGGSPAESA
jgi:hypothetical protein